MTMLIFAPSDNLKKIFQHTKEAEKWSHPYGWEGIPANMENTMNIHFVKDDGIYLMSGAHKNLIDPEGGNLVVYAIGFEPGSDDLWNRSRDAVGGDDFVEPLPLDDKMVKQVINGLGFFVEIEDNGMKYGTFDPNRRYFPTTGKSVED